MRTIKPLMTILGATALLAATIAPAAAQDADGAGAQQGSLQYTPLFLCDAGQPTGFDLAPCDMDDEAIHIVFDSPFESTGMLDGIGSFSGLFSVRPDNTFYADGKGIFVGEVEGCGTGTVHFLLEGHEGYYDDEGVPVWTAGSWDVVSGGTLEASGSFEGHGRETVIVPFLTGGIDYIGEITCADEV